MNLLTTILSYIFTGGLASGVSILFCLKSTKRKEAAAANDLEEQVESKSIQNDRDKLAFYDVLVDNLTNRLNSMLLKLNEAEQRNARLTVELADLQMKYNELEKKYSELERRYK